MTTNIPQPQHTLRGTFTGYLADVEGHGLRGPLLPEEDVVGHGLRGPLLPEEDVEAHGKMSGLVADGKYTGLVADGRYTSLNGDASGKNTP